MRKVDPNTIGSLMDELEALPPVEKPRRTYAAIRELAPAIDRALARGQDIEAIRELLERAGIQLRSNSLRAYLRRANAKLSHGTHAAVAPPSGNTPPASARRVSVSAPSAARANSTRPKEDEPSTDNDPTANGEPRGHFQPKPDSTEI